MRLRCSLCSRWTVPAILIGQEPIGPKCARRSGLLSAARIRGSRVTLVRYKAERRQDAQLDLFEEVAA